MSEPLRFDISRLREDGGLRSELELDAETFIDRRLPGTRPEGTLRLEVELSLGGEDVLLEVRARGAWILTCSRCLCEHRLDYDCAIEETYPLKEGELDVADDVRQAVLLEVPPRSLCREDCRGLCPQCGQNLNAAPCACRVETPSPFAALKNPVVKKEEKRHAEP
ncbi:MAG: DUF177 domain-containing protein [Elusimicrobiota bacterium]